MIGIGIGVNRQRFRGGGGGFDADYQAVLNYATSQGYTLPSASQQILQNQLVVDLKDGGIWNELDTFRVYATDAGEDFALIDWKRLINCTPVNSPTFISNQGFQGNGSSSYINTNFNPNTLLSQNNYKLNDASFGCWVYEIPTIGVYVQGTITGNSSRYALGNFLEQRVNGLNCNATVNMSNTGFKMLSKTSSLNYSFVNDTTKTTRTTTIDEDTITNFVDLAGVGSSLLSFSNTILSIGYAGGNLDLQSLNFRNALNNYIASL